MTDAGEKLSNRAKKVAAVFAGELTAAWERAIFAQSGSALRPLRFEGHVRHVEPMHEGLFGAIQVLADIIVAARGPAV